MAENQGGAKRSWAGTRDRHPQLRPASSNLLIWTRSIRRRSSRSAGLHSTHLSSIPRRGRPMINWALGTFGDKNAKVEVDRAEHQPPDRVLRTLEWQVRSRASRSKSNWACSASFQVIRGQSAWCATGKSCCPSRRPRTSTRVQSPTMGQRDRRGQRRHQVHAQRETAATSGDRRRQRFVREDGSVRWRSRCRKNRITFDELQRDWGGALKGFVTAKGDNLRSPEIAGASALTCLQRPRALS